MKYLQQFYGAAFLLLIICLAGSSLIVKAAGNHLDYTFGEDGKTLFFRSVGVYQTAVAMAVQSNGKFFTVGTIGNIGSFHSAFVIARFNGDGTPDSGFYNNGITTANWGGRAEAHAIVLQGDGKILVIGNNTDPNFNIERLVMARFNTDGTFDTTFDNDGRLEMSDLKVGNDIALQSDGKIIIAGNAPNNRIVVKRLNTDGSLDTTFGSNGQVSFDFVSNPRLIAQPDGKIVVLGTYLSNDNDFILFRLLTTGSIDGTFNGNGSVQTNFGGNDKPSAIKRMFDGKLVVTGTRTANLRTDIVLARYNTNGSLDTTFDGDGKVITDLGASSAVYNLAVALNGEIVVAGRCKSGSTDLFTLIRYRNDGSRQNTFGTGGRVNTIFGMPFGSDSAVARDVAFQVDGRIVAVGTFGENFSAIAVARYNRQGIASSSDFTNDGQADFTVFRPSDGNWYALNSATQAYSITRWGQADDIPVPGDYDGDGKTDAAIFRGGIWYILKSSTNNFIITQFGLASDKPVAGDYDGDSKTDIAVYRPSDGVWHLLQSTRGYQAAAFGISEDKPVPGDYDGDGLTDLAVFRPSNGVWHLQRSVSGYTAVQFGSGGDIAVPADYDGDGFTDIAVWRPSNGVWYAVNSHNNSTRIQQWGTNGDIPAPADYDADGKADLTVFRPSNGVWYSYQSSTGAANILSWGQNGDLPIASRYSPQ